MIGQTLYRDFEQNRYKKDTYYKTTGRNVVYYEYYPKRSKNYKDQIDQNIARHYSLTDEELDLNINYDIK